MSTQIAVRLPDGLVDFVDRLISEGRATSRAAVVSRALHRELRREIAARDAAILAGTDDGGGGGGGADDGDGDDDLDGLARHGAQTPLDDLD